MHGGIMELPTAKEVAEATGVTADTARGWLSGRGSMPVRALAAIKKVCPWVDINLLLEIIEQRQEEPVDLRSKGCRNVAQRDKPTIPKRRSVRERRGIDIEAS